MTAVQAEERFQAGDHCELNTSRQISPVCIQARKRDSALRGQRRHWAPLLPPLTFHATFGCQILLTKRIEGGLVGYEAGTVMLSSKVPPVASIQHFSSGVALSRANYRSHPRSSHPRALE